MLRPIRRRTRRPPAPLALLAIAAFLAVTACSGSGAPSTSVEVTGAWVRATGSAAEMSAAYFSIANHSTIADALTAASSPAAGMAQIMQTTTTSGMSGMAPIDGLPVPAGSTVALAPGGFHVMLMDLTAPLPPGSSVELDLTFQHAGHIVVHADVRAP